MTFITQKARTSMNELVDVLCAMCADQLTDVHCKSNSTQGIYVVLKVTESMLSVLRISATNLLECFTHSVRLGMNVVMSVLYADPCVWLF